MRILPGLVVAVLWALSLTAITSAFADERRVALVIGNGAYVNAPALENPVHDAQAMRDKLKSLGFDVVSGFDLTKAQTQEVIAKFAETVRGSDVALLFYAGHGMQVAGTNYLVPVDAALKDEISIDFETVPMDFIWRQMARGTKVRVAFLDACRDNPFARLLAASGRSSEVPTGLAEMQIENSKTGGALVAFATSPGQVAYDGVGGHSPFTSALLAHLGDPNLPLTTVMTRVTGDVVNATQGKQRPWVNVSLTDELMLDKIAAPAPAPGETAVAPAEDQAAIERLRKLIPKIDDKGPITFDGPIQFGDPKIDGKSIAALIAGGQPLYPPVEGLDKAAWQQPCSACHQWTKPRLCTASGRFDRVDVSVLRLEHPYGSRFKVALAKWAKDGCM